MYLMKKLLLSILLFLPFGAMTGCTPTSIFTDSPLLISEIYFGELVSEAIELYNCSDDDIDLSNYSLDIYRNAEKEASYHIDLEGVLEPNHTYVIANSSASEEVINKADIITDQYRNNGVYPIVLKRGNTIMDVVGSIGYNVDYAYGHSLVRKVDHMQGKNVFDTYDFIRYNPLNIDLLGNATNTVTPDELLEGPKLDEKYFSYPYSSSSLLGGGGAVQVQLDHSIDGDTTSFIYPSYLLDELGIRQRTSMRYQNVDTPESTLEHDPWGKAASNFTMNLLYENINELYVQSCLGGALHETYGRLLGFVWAGDTLINYALVLNGYSYLLQNEFMEMSYKGISYYSFMYNAELLASRQGLKIHGELDPDWDYELDVPL